MKILMLGWELPPHNSGGLGVACYYLCKALANKGADIEFVLPYNAQHEINFMKISAAQPQGIKEILTSGIAYDSYKYIFSDGKEEYHDIFSQQLMYEYAVARMATNREFDIVHAHDWLTFRAALRVKELKQCPIILHVHSVESDRAGGKVGNPFVHEIEQTAFSLADRIIAVSRHTKKTIVEDYDIPGSKIDVIHNSLNYDELEDDDNSNAYTYLTAMKSQGYKVVSNVGRLTVQKGLINLLKAAREVILQAPKTLFLIVGSGEQYIELLTEANSLGIGKSVIFTGFQRGKSWRDAYKISDVFVMPSISEPFGLTALEAIGYGSPVILSHQAGVSEVIKNCLKVDFWDINELANQIAGVVMNTPLHDTLASNSLNELRQLSWDQSANKVFDSYSRSVNKNLMPA